MVSLKCVIIIHSNVWYEDLCTVMAITYYFCNWVSGVPFFIVYMYDL